MNKSTVFRKELETIKNDDIRQFAETLIENAPEYFFHVPASSSGKWHPSISLGEGGLVRHTKAVIRFYNHIMGVEQYNNAFTEREIDLGIVACLAHDIQKSGTQQYYEEHSENGTKTVFTVFEHPLLASKYVLETEGIPKKERAYIAYAIESHMGSWNTDKRNPKTVLPKPTTKMQELVHLADYLASRKDIELQFDDDEKEPVVPIEEFVFPYRKHKGELLVDVAKNDRPYLVWCYENIKLPEPLKSYCKVLLEVGE